MNTLLILKRSFIRLSRIRHRCGYGVHSPFAFELITCLIYERTPYYAYKQLATQEKNGGDFPAKESQKINRLLFRLVNRMQPATIIHAGILSFASSYLRAGRSAASYLHVSTPSELSLDTNTPIDFLYLNSSAQPALSEAFFNSCASGATPRSLFVIRDIHASKAMRQLWERIKEDERVGITFDLYDLGIIFFDRTKIKQHYLVNF